MKKHIITLFIAMLTLPAMAILDEVVPAQIAKAVTTAGTPVQLTATRTQAASVVVQARKSVSTANTGNVFLGVAGAAGTQLLVLEPGQSVSFTAANAKAIDLSDFWVDSATNGDGIIVTYIK
jgi:hypothetical protein